MKQKETLFTNIYALQYQWMNYLMLYLYQKYKTLLIKMLISEVVVVVYNESAI